jgi:hypothetical protein
MGVRGRSAAAALSIVHADVLSAVPRPKPPAELTDEQGDEWRRIVNRLPADWFPVETQPLLAQLCRHIVRARRLAQLLDAAERAAEFDAKEYGDLAKLEESQSRTIATLATKMRLSQQTTYDESTRKGKVAATNLWDSV